MAFESLTDKLQNVFKKLRSKGRLTEEDVKIALKEVKMALLEADVNFRVVKQFTKSVQERAVGQDVMNGLNPGQMVIKIVNEELVNLMGSETTELPIKPGNDLTVLMMAGLQGAGKTTTAAKLAGKIKSKGKRPLLVACDVYRPAAITQLQVNGEKQGVEVFTMGDKQSPVEIAMMLVQIVMNNSLTFYGASSIYGEAIPLACAGIVIKVNQIFFSIVIGLSQGSQPVESFNYGAKKYDRVRKAYRLAALTGVIISIFSFVLFQIFPRQILGLFGTGEPEYFTFGVRFFRIFLFFIWLDALQPITSTFFTSIGKPAKGIFLSLTRQIIFFIPLLLILPRFMGIEGCIYCGPIADFLSAVVTIIMAFLEFKNMPKQDENR